MNIGDNIAKFKTELGDQVTLVAISKTKPSADIQEAYDAGQRIFGENRPQEMQSKAEELPNDIQWHMVGHLQSNKVKYIAPFVSLIHSIDKLKLLKEVNKRAKQNERCIDVLLQIHIAKEESKFGMDEEEVKELLDSEGYEKLENVRVVGLMGMATFTDNESRIEKEFDYLKQLFDELKSSYFSQEDSFGTLSMGMSSDYKIALKAGSTMVRVGSSIFGARD